MGQSVSRGLRHRGKDESDPYRDSSVHSCRSVHPEEEEDPEVLRDVRIDDDKELGSEAASEVGSDIGHRHKPPRATTSLADGAVKDQDSKSDIQLQHKRLGGEPAQNGEGLSNGNAKAEEAADGSKGKTGLLGHVRSYFCRMRGGTDTHLKIPELLDMALGWLGAFVSILILAVMNKWLSPDIDFEFLIASFGASAVLLFGAGEGKLSQPRNLVGGHVLSAIVGCTVRVVLRNVLWLSAALGMSLSLFVMNLTRTLHPPGGATALIAATATNLSPGQGYRIVLSVLIDSLIMLVVALAINNIRRSHRYPTFWW